MTADFKIGDRVRVKPGRVKSFVQPWRSRFDAGRVGTVISGPSANIRGFLIEWDHKRVKYPADWRLVHWGGDLELAEDGA